MMKNEIYLSVAQASDLLGISQESLYKQIQSNNLTTIQDPDQRRTHKVLAVSELSRLYGDIYIPEGYLEYAAGGKSVDFVRVALRQENERFRRDLEGTQKREQRLNEQLTAALQNNKALIETNAALTKTLETLTSVLDNMS